MYKNIIFLKKKSIFCLIHMNNKLNAYKLQKNIALSIVSFTKINNKKKIGFFFRIRIHIKMKWIRNNENSILSFFRISNISNATACRLKFIDCVFAVIYIYKDDPDIYLASQFSCRSSCLFI